MFCVHFPNTNTMEQVEVILSTIKVINFPRGGITTYT